MQVAGCSKQSTCLIPCSHVRDSCYVLPITCCLGSIRPDGTEVAVRASRTPFWRARFLSSPSGESAVDFKERHLVYPEWASQQRSAHEAVNLHPSYCRSSFFRKVSLPTRLISSSWGSTSRPARMLHLSESQCEQPGQLHKPHEWQLSCPCLHSLIVVADLWKGQGKRSTVPLPANQVNGWIRLCAMLFIW